MDYTILATELQQPQYSGMDDVEIAAALNAPGAATMGFEGNLTYQDVEAALQLP